MASLVALVTVAWSFQTGSGGSAKALQKAGALRAKDVPASWKSSPVSGGFTNTLQGVSGCEEQSPALDLPQRRAASRAFYDPKTRGGGQFPTQASNVVRVFTDADAAGQFMAAYKAESAGPCLQQSNQNDLERRNPSADVSVANVGPLSGVESGGDDSVGYEFSVMVTADQQQLAGSMDVTFVQVGRVVVGSKVVGEQSQLVSQHPDIVNNPVGRVEKIA